MKTSPSLRLTLSLLVIAALSALPVAAQPPAANDSTVVFPASYFAEYAPVTAQDMVDRIPGVGNITGGGPPVGGGDASRGGRGLGAGGGGGDEILVNGKRVAGKNNETRGLLNRITANQVDYIELIRGTSGDLDVRANQIVNIVLFEELSSNSISYEVNMDRYADHHTQPGGNVALSGKSGGLNYYASLVAEPRYDNRISKERSILGDFSPNDLVREERTREQTTYQLTGNISYELTARSSLRFNALYAENDNPTDVDRWTTNLRVTPNVITQEREEIPGENDNWEIGGDYDLRLANGGRFRALFISNENNSGSVRERYRVNSNGSETKNLFLDSATTVQEKIVRGSYTMKVFGEQDLEFGIERAQTTLDSALRLGVLSSSGIPSPAYGGLVPQPVSGANDQVEEIRYEPFLVHNWQINPRMSLESSLVYETSEITQTGDSYNQRDFQFFKPKVDYRFNVTPAFQLRGVLETSVRQLAFQDFVASTDAEDNDSNTQSGNAGLEPETFLRADVNAEYRLPNDLGVVDGGIMYMIHWDKIERIDVSPSPTDIRSANGNIGDGDMWIGRLNASIRMGMFDMPNLLITSGVQLRDSRIKDPFLGIYRRFQNYDRGSFNFGFRHDVARYNMNWGLSWNNRFDGNIKRYDIDDIELSAEDPRLSLFLEFVAFGGTTFRFDARNALDNLQCRERQRFVGRISAGILEEIEDQCAGSGRVVSLKISGTF